MNQCLLYVIWKSITDYSFVSMEETDDRKMTNVVARYVAHLKSSLKAEFPGGSQRSGI